MSKTVFEVGEETFQDEVLERSRTVPVLVDFWAPWCGPCRTLGPVLEALASEAGGRWVLAKVNSDENPELAQAYGIRGIPAVKAFIDGTVIDEFTGALPRPAIEEFLKAIIPSEAERLAKEAAEAGERGDRDEERRLWDATLEADPEHALARVRRARLFMASGELDEATADLERIASDSPFHDDAQNLLRLGRWARRIEGAGGLEMIRARAAESPDDVGARYDLGCAFAVTGDFEGALAEFLEVVRHDRTYEDDAGREAMLSLFALLGDDHELTREYRDRLTAVLF